MHSYSRIHIHRSTINGTVQGITNGVYGTMSGGVFDVKLAPKRSNQKEVTVRSFLTRTINLRLLLMNFNIRTMTKVQSGRKSINISMLAL